MQFLRRPIIQPPTGNADCGYMCVIAALAVRSRPVLLESLKREVGNSTRGLSIRQMRNAFAHCGFDVSPMFYDKSRIDSVPVPSAILCDQGHWIFILARKGSRFEIYDPNLGWSRQKFPRLRRRANGLAIALNDFWTAQVTLPEDDTRSALRRLNARLRKATSSPTVWKALGVFLLAQLFVLAMPLISMWSADRAFAGMTTSVLGFAAIAFLALSLTNVLVTLGGDLLHTRIRRLTENRVGEVVFAALRSKPFEWFESSSPANLQHKIASLAALVDYYVAIIRSASMAAISLVAGVVVLFFVSPALVVPGLIGLVLSIAIDLLMERRQHNFISSHVGASQGHQRFVLETLSQFPMFARHDATANVRRRYRALTRQQGSMQAQLQSFQSWRSGLLGISKSAENLFFVILAAAFMGAGEFEIGGFVALGAYKDLLSGALSSFFRLAMEYRSLAVHRMQAASLFDDERATKDEARAIASGTVSFNAVSFRYGTFENAVLKNASFAIETGEFVVMQGRSGLGKSTIAKLMLGQLSPDGGSVSIDGANAATGLKRVSSIFQSDPLITGSIRENLTLFKLGYEDTELWEALKAAQLDDFVRRLPMKLETPVGEGLGGLSGGQKQRLLIARAVVLKPRLLVLDEATSSLDTQTEQEVFAALRRLDCTIFAIAHRPEVVKFADRVLAITEEGSIREIAVSTVAIGERRQKTA